jgi:hypothetical protein
MGLSLLNLGARHPQLAIMDPINGGVIGTALVSMGPTVRNLVEKADERLTLRDIEPQEVPLPVLLPLLEAASSEDDAEMQEYWATLLANAASGTSIPPTFTRLLQALRPIDAKVLDACAQLDDIARHRGTHTSPLDRGGYVVSRRDVKDLVGIQSWTELELCVDTLTSLRLVEPTPAIYPLEWEAGEDVDLPLRVTPLGRAFFAAVNPKLAE